MSAPGMGASRSCAVRLRASMSTGCSPLSISASNSAISMRSAPLRERCRRRSAYLKAMNRPSTLATTTSAVLPIVDRISRTSSTLSWNQAPSRMPTPLHSAAPVTAYSRKGFGATPIAPDNGAAMVLKPGTNLDTSSDLTPNRLKRSSVWLTHESGDREILHSSRRMRLP